MPINVDVDSDILECARNGEITEEKALLIQILRNQEEGGKKTEDATDGLRLVSRLPEQR